VLYNNSRRLLPFLFMDKKTNNTPWWRDGLIIFAKVSAYIAVPVIFASYLGKYLDQKYNTGNLLFLVLVCLAFISTIYLIWREMKIYKKKIDIPAQTGK
jgi:heme/copper-type cytochrome/quinol oxidase subunit 4